MSKISAKILWLLDITSKPGGGGIVTEGEFGVEWDYSAPSPALTRTGDAAGFADPVPATTLAEVGSSPFDNIMPWAGMKMCNIINGEVVYWQGDPQFSETDYDTMVYIPEFWYKAEKHTDTHKWNWSISPTEKEGYAKHPGSGRYVGRYHSSGSPSGIFSKSDAMPIVQTTRPDFRTYSHSKGQKWWMLDVATWSAIQMLYLIEYSNFDSQVMLGTGNVTEQVSIMGGTDGAAYHTLRTFGASNQYRWVEDPFSNSYDYVDGFLTINRAVYIGLDNSRFSESTSGLTKTNVTLPSTGWISGYGFSEQFPFAFLPNAGQGSGTTYVTDRIASRTDTYALYVGGDYNDNTYFGIFYFNASNLATSAYADLGSRLIYVP